MIINGYEFSVGADPEVFVKHNGSLRSAYNLIPGTKDNPHKVNGGAVQVDGMALEFNINPAKDYVNWETNLTKVLDTLTSMVPGYEIFISPVAHFGAEYIEQQPEKAKELGCSPDFNAYTKDVNPIPSAATPFRTASGHIHIGWHKEPVDPLDPGHFEACCTLAKNLDVFLGAPSLLWDKDEERRTLYGQAGAFRPKPYGMEYRVLSNLWLKTPLLRRFVYHNTIKAIQHTFQSVNNKTAQISDVKIDGHYARDLINKVPTTLELTTVGLESGEDIQMFVWQKILQDLFIDHNIPSPASYK